MRNKKIHNDPYTIRQLNSN